MTQTTGFPYTPPLTEGATLIDFKENENKEIYPGVCGYAMTVGDAILIPHIIARVEGSGQVGKMLDALSPDVGITNVISGRLAGMLTRRGWALAKNLPIDVWYKPSVLRRGF